MFDVAEADSGTQLRAAMRRLVTEAHEYLRALPNHAFFAPQGDRWSPAEHIRHLRKSTAPVAQALRVPAWLLRLRFGQGAGTSRNYRTLRDTYRGVLAQGGQAGRFAPSPEPAPTDPTARRAAIMSAWDAAVGALETASARWSEASLERAWLPHPLLGLLTVREMLEFTVYHTSHHLTLVASRVESGSLTRRRNALGVTARTAMTHPTALDYRFTCDAAPVQAEGTLDGQPFFFRARGEQWTFSLAEEPELDPVYIESDETAAGRGYFLAERYGDPGSFAASHMALGTARELIEECARRYRAHRSA